MIGTNVYLIKLDYKFQKYLFEFYLINVYISEFNLILQYYQCSAIISVEIYYLFNPPLNFLFSAEYFWTLEYL